MRALPPELVLEKNKIANARPWIILAEIYPGDGSVYRIARNTEDVVFRGETYTAFPFELEMTETSKAELPRLRLRVSNISRVFQYAVEITQGGVGSKVIFKVVHAGHLDTAVPELEMQFQILSVTANAQWITFTLGAPNPMLQRCPRHRFLQDFCRWKFKSPECGYSGPQTSCNKTLAQCRAYGNEKRFGGFPSIHKGQMRYV